MIMITMMPTMMIKRPGKCSWVIYDAVMMKMMMMMMTMMTTMMKMMNREYGTLVCRLAQVRTSPS